MIRPLSLFTVAGAVVACLVPASAAAAATTSTTAVRVPAVVTVGVTTTVSAVVRPVSATGTVRFSVGGSTLTGCSAAPVTQGRATCRTMFTSGSPTTVVAAYSGGGTVAASSGQVVVRAVDGASGTIVGGVGDCTRQAGALVAVSYGAWDGPIVRGCDTTLTTGIDLLTTAGFTTTGTRHDGPQFLCRIGHPFWKAGAQYPTAATEACVNTPPADAYWSYWLAAKGRNVWTYSPLGAYADRPTAGAVEAWTFGPTDIGGTTGRPAFTPNQVRSGLPTG